MFKNSLKLNNIKNKFITIILSVICAVMFVFIGVKAVNISTLSSDSLLVNGSVDFLGGLDVNGGINVFNGKDKKFSVDKNGNVFVGGDKIIDSNRKWLGNRVNYKGDNGLRGATTKSDKVGPQGKTMKGPQGDKGPEGPQGNAQGVNICSLAGGFSPL